MPRQLHRHRGEHPYAGPARQFGHHDTDQAAQPSRATLIALQHTRNLLTKRPSAAIGRADQAPDPDHELHSTGINGDIIDEPLVIAMNPHRRGPAIRTAHRARRRPRPDPNSVSLVDNLVHDQR